MKHTGNLTITKENAHQYKELVEVTGSLYIDSDAKLGNLQTVGGNLYIRSDAKLEADNLQTVGGSLHINSDAKLDNLQTVGGSLHIYSDAKLNSLQTVGGSLSIYSDAKLEADNAKYNCTFEDFLEKGFVYADGILTKLIHKRGNVYTTERLGTNKRVYVIKEGDTFAHGKSVKAAKIDLAFKLSDRDISEYEGMSSDTTKSPEEWAAIYRIITGSCQEGIDMFMDSKKLKKQYTLEEILKETDGAYGFRTFAEVVG